MKAVITFKKFKGMRLFGAFKGRIGGAGKKNYTIGEGEVKVVYYSTKTSGLYIPGLFSNHRCSLIGVVLNSPLYTVNCCD